MLQKSLLYVCTYVVLSESLKRALVYSYTSTAFFLCAKYILLLIAYFAPLQIEGGSECYL